MYGLSPIFFGLPNISESIVILVIECRIFIDFFIVFEVFRLLVVININAGESSQFIALLLLAYLVTVVFIHVVLLSSFD